MPRDLRTSLAPVVIKRFYPGFWAALFLILLRTAIGWHFLYEGLLKIQSVPSQRDSLPGRVLTQLLPPPPAKDKDRPFSAETYLRNATGPLAPYFRSLIPDGDGQAKFGVDPSGRPTGLGPLWVSRLERASAHYAFNSDQRAKAEAALAAAKSRADEWFLLAENRDKVSKYFADLEKVNRIEADWNALPFQKEAAAKQRTEVETARKELFAEVEGWTKSLDTTWTGLASETQKSRGPTPEPLTQLDLINLSVMWGTVAVGIGLLLGFLTPLSALGAATFLALFYLSMPPWRGLPDNPLAEGHYLFVNKNLIEFLACLVIASTPNGLWVGLDALLFGRKARRAEARRLERQLPPVAAALQAGAQPSGSPSVTIRHR
jgi:uncharacterized membrane protein YphA (DoxX/SURF4 family)